MGLSFTGDLHVKQKKYQDGELVLGSAVEHIAKSTSADTWIRYRAESLLGASLAGQKKLAESEPLLVSGYEGMLQRCSTIPAFYRIELKEARERIVKLYQESGNPEKAAEGRAKLEKSLPVERAH